MKWSLLLLIIAETGIVYAANLTLTNLVSSDGKTYHNASIMRIEGHEAVIMHSQGIVRLPVDSLPNDARKAFGFPTDDEMTQQKSERLQNLVRENKEGDEVRARQRDELQRNANVKMTVKGGAWLTRKAGNSEVLRGLRIVAYNNIVSTESTLKYLSLITAAYEGRLRLYEKQADVNEHPYDLKFYIDKKNAAASDLKLWQQALPHHCSSARKGAYDLRILSGFLPPIDVNALHVISNHQGLLNINAWTALLEGQEIASETHAGVDGTYTLQVSGGEHFLSAFFSSAYSTAFWLIPVRATEPVESKIDFHNETAFLIWNLQE